MRSVSTKNSLAFIYSIVISINFLLQIEQIKAVYLAGRIEESPSIPSTSNGDVDYIVTNQHASLQT